MNEEQKKRLTNWLGECWHERGDKARFNPWQLTETWECKNCKKHHTNRTFTEHADFFACFEKLVERGEWKEFHVWARHQFCKDFVTVFSRNEMESAYNAWLNSRTESGNYRLCVLCAEWLRKGE
jgi:hypothetical protein